MLLLAQPRDDALDLGLCELRAGLGAAVALGEDEFAAVLRPVFAVDGAAGVALHADDPGDFHGLGAGGVGLKAGPVHARQRAAATIPLSVFLSKGDIQLGAQGTVLM